jgi:hypothetical protein
VPQFPGLDILGGKYVRSDRVVFRKVADETILVPMCADVGDLGAVYVLNPVGAAVWVGLDSNRSGDDLVRQIADEFETTEDVAARDVGLFLKSLLDVGLISPCGDPGP